MAVDQNSVQKELRPLSFDRKIVDISRVASVPDVIVGDCARLVSNSNSRVELEKDASFRGYDSLVAPYAVASHGGGGVQSGPGMPSLLSGGIDFPPNWVGGNSISRNWIGGNALPEPSVAELVQHGANGYARGRFGGDDGSSQRSIQQVDSVNSGHDSRHAEVSDNLGVKKVKFLCSFGGKILPRPSDGMLRYVGGQTRIISVKEGVCYQELMQKMHEAYGQSMIMKYQLPNEDLDALVSVSCDEDVENMMEEYSRLLDGSVDGASSSKFRVFLFTQEEIDQPGFMQFGDVQDTGQRYVEAVNGIIPDNAIKAKDSACLLDSEIQPGAGDAGDSRLNGQVNAEGKPPQSPCLISLSPVSPHAANVSYFHHPSPLDFTKLPLQQDLPSSISTGPVWSMNAHQPISNRIGPLNPFAVPELEGSSPSMGVVQPDQRSIAPPVRLQDDVASEQHPIQKTEYTSKFNGGNMDLYGVPGYSYCQAPDAPSLDFAPQLASELGNLNSQNVGNKDPLCKQPDRLWRQQDDIMDIPSSPFHHVLQPEYVLAGSAPCHTVSKSSTPQTNLQQNRVLKFVPLEQIQIDHFLEENLAGVRAQLHDNLVSTAPQPQPASLFSAQSTAQHCAGHQDLVTEHLVYPEGWSNHHPTVLFETIKKLDDCCICHKVSPDVHSDTLLQENVSSTKSVHESDLTIHPSSSVECMKFRAPLCSLWPFSEAIVDLQDTNIGVTSQGYQASGGHQRIIGQDDGLTAYEIPVPIPGLNRFSHMPEEQHDLEMILGPKNDRPESSGLLLSQSPDAMLDMPNKTGGNCRIVTEGPNEVVAHRIGSGLPSGTYQSYHALLNGLPLSHQEEVIRSFVPSYPCNTQDLTTDLLGGIDTVTLGASFPPPDVFQNSLAGFRPIYHPPAYVPTIQVRAVEGTSKTVCLNPPEVFEVKKQCKSPVLLTPVSSKDEICSLLDAQSAIHDTEAIITGNANGTVENEDIPPEQPYAPLGVHAISSISKAPVILEENQIMHIDPLACKPKEAMFVQSAQPKLSSKSVHLQARPGPSLDVGMPFEPTVFDDPRSALPTSEHISSMYSDDISGVPVLGEVGVSSQARGAFENLVHLTCTTFPPKSADNPSRRIEECLESAVQTPSACLSDPWDLVQDVTKHVIQIINPATSEVLVPTDAYRHNFSEICGSSRTGLRVEKLSFSQPLDVENEARNNELYLAHLSGSKVDTSIDEHVKRENRAVPEGLTISVLQTSVPEDATLFAPAIGSDLLEISADVEERNDDASSDSAQETFDSIAESFRVKLMEISTVLPSADDIRHLQIIKNSDLEELRELGSGTFGTVYHGKWRGSDVAIKRINNRCFSGKPSEQQRMRTDFWNEACKLADLHHPNVVAFYGVVLDGPGGTVATVTEFMANGSLRQALHKNDRILDRRRRIYIAMDVAFGMEYLHGKNIVHFDLKSDNLLVNLRDPQRPICKVGDLGLSKVKCRTLISGGVRGTLPWMAPELLNGRSIMVSEKVDVFSFGIVMWELLNGEEPYADLHYGAIIGGIVSNSLRPAVPDNCDPEWRSLMEKCWSSDPLERPSFTEVASTLRLMAAALQPKGPPTS